MAIAGSSSATLTERLQLTPLLAGAISGLMSTWFKFGWDAFWPPREAGRLPPTEVLTTMFTHHAGTITESHLVSFIFCIVFGIGYAILIKRFRAIALGKGLLFGFLTWLGAHEIAMPLLGLTPPAWQLTANEQVSEMFGHALWGMAVAAFYKTFRESWSMRNR